MRAQKISRSCQGAKEKGEKVAGTDSTTETVGAASLRLLSETSESHPAPEYQREMQKEFMDNVEEAVRRGLSLGQKTFYVVVLYRKDRLIPNLIRQQFFPRRSCPTPDYDQTVFRFDTSTCELTYLWTVPDHASLQLMLFSSDKMDEEYRALSQFCQDFCIGKLDKLAAELNGETT